MEELKTNLDMTAPQIKLEDDVDAMRAEIERLRGIIEAVAEALNNSNYPHSAQVVLNTLEQQDA